MSKLKYWTRNADVIDNPAINIKFSELILMDEEKLTNWINRMRDYIREVWDLTGVPPLSGASPEELRETFKEMKNYPVAAILQTDEMTGKENAINLTGSLGSVVNQFFPTMMKVPINYSTKVSEDGNFSGYSVYDLFAEERFRPRMQKGCRRHFRRDSFYKYSISIEKNTEMGIIKTDSGYNWCKLFHENPSIFEGTGYWLNEVDPADAQGSGYTSIDANKFLQLTGLEVDCLIAQGVIKSDIHLTNLPGPIMDHAKQYHIRFYQNDTRIFPTGFTAFRIGYASVPVNFPPLIAKFLWERYTSHIQEKEVIVMDPSCGWGGRIAGAMLANRKVHYVGTDPNTDNYLEDEGMSRYEYLANFINHSISSGSLMRFMGNSTNTFEVFQDGSEMLQFNPEFQKYKGKLDLVFTSPPYFNREAYSKDETQSCNKFQSYSSWRDGFLRPTLETMAEYLKRDRYLLWNIADVKIGDDYLPLEQDSVDILAACGLRHVDTLRMLLASMPGKGRIGKDGKPTAKNFCRVGGRYRKYEPIYLFYKD